MNISNLSSALANPYQANATDPGKQRAQDFKALETALQSGNLADAQKAFAAVQKDIQNAPQGSPDASATDGQTKSATDLQSLADALNAGDVSTAQQSFAALKQDLQSVRGKHGHHHPQEVENDGDGDDNAPAPAAATTETTGTLLNTLA